jgi:hypothetical protein
MRALLFAALFLISALPSMGQSADDSKPALPKDPRAVFGAAAPFYDFSDPTLKPWHLKASYQLYDDKGKPSEQGTYEYWWASPKVYRSSWTRAGASRTDWHTADGKHTYTATGDDLTYFEYQLQKMLLSPLPAANWLDPTKHDLLDESLTSNGSRIPCYEIVPAGTKRGSEESLLGLSHLKYCFGPRMPIVIGIYSHKSSFTKQTLLAKLGDFVQMQGRVLPRDVVFKYGNLNRMTARLGTVELAEAQGTSDAVFVPPALARLVTAETISDNPAVIVGKMTKRAEMGGWGISGNYEVQLQVVIGTDGLVRAVYTITATTSAFAAHVKERISHTVYQPSTLNGEPVQIQVEDEITLRE